ncbi:MAG: hypothetical protein R3E97_19210 [Candidatus Eisenbacteria bacterium]
MIPPIPRRDAFSAAIDSVDPSLPGADLELFELVAHQLDRFHALSAFERRDPAFRILDGLASWAKVWGGQGSPYERVLLQVWNPTQTWLNSTFLDLFPNEAVVVNSLPLPRFLTMQGLGTSIALVLSHRPSWTIAAALLTENMDATDASWTLIRATEQRLQNGWAGEEMTAWILGGSVDRDGPRASLIRQALLEARVPDDGIDSPWSPRTPDTGPIHVVYDRTEGRMRPFNPGFDPVYYNMRTRLDREKSRVHSMKEAPTLIWAFQEVR